DHLTATLDIATAPQESAIVRTIHADCRPNGLVVIMPEDLTSPQNRSRLKIDRELAEETGKLADAFDGPTFGKPPERVPFLVPAKVEESRLAVDAAITARERKTLGYFGFTPAAGRILHAKTWFATDKSYSAPDLARMTQQAKSDAQDYAP